MLAISDRQLRDLANRGHIPFVNVGCGNRPTRRYDPVDIEAFMLARKSSTCPSTSGLARWSTATTSVIDASDFQARLNARAKRATKPSN